MIIFDVLCKAGICSVLLHCLDSKEELALLRSCKRMNQCILSIRNWKLCNVDCIACTSQLSMEMLNHLKLFSPISHFLIRESVVHLDTVVCLLSPDNFYLSYVGSAGWGLMSYTVIPRFASILAYYGEYISTTETLRRQLEYDEKLINYILTVKEHTLESIDADGSEYPSIVMRTNIDATLFGGIARFVNHSCDPNCEIVMHRPPGTLLGQPILRTLRVIAPGEEITFDYGDTEVNEPEQKRLKLEKVGTPCCCGAKNCRKYLPSV